MSRRSSRFPIVLAIAILVAALAPAGAGGRAAGTRPHSGSGGTASRQQGGHSQPQASRPPSHEAHGHATYGYGNPWYGYGGPWYGYGGPWYDYAGWYPDAWWSVGIGWGWPYFGWDPWWPGPVGYPYCTAGLSGDLALERIPAQLETDVRPRKASVRLDGERIGDARDFNGTWNRLPLDPGSHVMEFEAPGYMTLRVRIEARPGRVYRVDDELRRGDGLDPRSSADAAPEAAPRRSLDEEAIGVPASGALERGFLRIAIDPPDAAVYLDGAYLARAAEINRLHGAIPVASGEHRVEVVRPGYRARSVQVQVGTDRPAEVRIELEPEN